MRAVGIVGRGADATLEVSEVPAPVVGDGQILIDVAAAGVNRADTVQRRGVGTVPSGASPLPGLEVSGVVREVGAGVTRWTVGERVCALLSGGGYAEQVAVDARHVLPVPDSVDLVSAAGLPETLATVWSNLVGLVGLTAGEHVLVHGAASGIGTTAIQVAKLLGATVHVTAGSPEKLAVCRDLGADHLIDYRLEDFEAAVSEQTGGRGVDVILDIVGADYLAKNVAALATGGRLVVIGLQSGDVTNVDLRAVLRKRAVITGSMLRSRSDDDKAQIMAELADHVLPAVADGRIRPVIDSTVDFAAAQDAHVRMEASAHVGKILLVP